MARQNRPRGGQPGHYTFEQTSGPDSNNRTVYRESGTYGAPGGRSGFPWRTLTVAGLLVGGVWYVGEYHPRTMQRAGQAVEDTLNDLGLDVDIPDYQAASALDTDGEAPRARAAERDGERDRASEPREQRLEGGPAGRWMTAGDTLTTVNFEGGAPNTDVMTVLLFESEEGNPVCVGEQCNVMEAIINRIHQQERGRGNITGIARTVRTDDRGNVSVAVHEQANLGDHSVDLGNPDVHVWVAVFAPRPDGSGGNFEIIPLVPSNSGASTDEPVGP